MKFIKNQFTVDPGWNTAIAMWGNNKTLHPEVKLLQVQKEWNEIKKINFISKHFETLLKEHKPVRVHIEDVGLWGSSSVSLASAQRGDTFRLAMLVGSMINVCSNYNIKVILHRPIDWKGNMNKEVVKRRVQRRNGVCYEDFWSATDAEHVYDCVGIGMSIMGVL